MALGCRTNKTAFERVPTNNNIRVGCWTRFRRSWRYYSTTDGGHNFSDILFHPPQIRALQQFEVAHGSRPRNEHAHPRRLTSTATDALASAHLDVRQDAAGVADPFDLELVFAPVLPVERHQREGRHDPHPGQAVDIAEVVPQREVVRVRCLLVPAYQGPQRNRSDHLLWNQFEGGAGGGQQRGG